MPGQWTAARIRALREALGLTQEQMANAVGVSFTTVNRWEHDTPPSPMAIACLERLERRAPKPENKSGDAPKTP